MRLHYRGREKETIQYVDVMTLYSYVFNYFNFAVAHTVIHVVDACKNREACLRMDGLIKCSIIPTETLYHPILPFRCNNKLMFFHCRTCVLTSSSSSSREDRGLTVTWVVYEVRLAVEKV